MEQLLTDKTVRKKVVQHLNNNNSINNTLPVKSEHDFEQQLAST